MTTKLLISNLVYGQSYADLYLGPHLTALLDASNVPAVRDRVSIECYTDADTAQYMRVAHSERVVDVTLIPLRNLKHEARYSLLAHCFHRSLHRAHAEGRALMFSTADTIYGQHMIPKLLEKLDEGHDAVMGVTMRGTAEGMAEPMVRTGRALTASELYGLCRSSLHPLWTHSNWDAQDFSSIPYSLVWSDAQQLLVRSLTITAVAFRPSEAMLALGPQTPDMMVDPYLTNPYYSHDWSEFPMVECQHLKSFWPPFRPGPASVSEYVAWAKIAGGFVKNLDHAFHYYDPSSKPSAESTDALRLRSEVVIRQIQQPGLYVEPVMSSEPEVTI